MLITTQMSMLVFQLKTDDKLSKWRNVSQKV